MKLTEGKSQSLSGLEILNPRSEKVCKSVIANEVKQSARRDCFTPFTLTGILDSDSSTTRIGFPLSSFKFRVSNFHISLFLFPLSAFLFSLSGCGVYSFTGASISPEVKSVSIDLFPSYAPLAPANMPQSFTESLRDLFVSRTNLDLLTKNGDIRFEGYISDYRTRPVAIQGNETAAKNRLSVTVNVSYTNTKDEAKSFEKNFSRFADFDATQNLVDVEQSLMVEINEQLILDIFNESVVNW